MTQDKLQLIRQACIEANPGKEWYTRWSTAVQVHPATLVDVLLAIHAVNPYSYFVDIRGDFWKWVNMDVAPIRNEHVRWNLREDDLTKQSPETIDFLYDVLTP